MKHSYPPVVLALVIACASFTTLAATDSAAPAAQMTIEELKSRLALTPEQQAQIAPLAEERRSKMEAIRGKLTSASRRDKREVLQEAKAVQDDFSRQVEPLLTKEQQAEWKQIREEMRAQMLDRWRKR